MGIAPHLKGKLMPVAYLIALIPTVVLLWAVGAFRLDRVQAKALWVATVLGALVTAPVWVVETAVEGPAAFIPDLYRRALLQQVVGASLVEELAILLAFFLAYLLFRTTSIVGPRDVVALAVSAAVGFTTVENLFAVWAAEAPLTVAVTRLLSLVAGHASLQLVMGYFAARIWLGEGDRLVNGLLMVGIPVAIHGWGDFSDAVFQAQEAIDPNGDAAKNWFTAWTSALFLYVASAAAVLWQMRYGWEGASPDPK
ncbi:MAG: PrsW family glutamic-type intramembrane protease [Gemmataceae bacterium]